MTTITLKEIRAAAETLGTAHAASEAVAAALRTELEAATRPIYQRFVQALDKTAADKSVAYAELMQLLDASPQLFVKPRSISVGGVKAGWRKEQDALNWEDEGVVIRRIRALLPDSEDFLIRTEESLIADGISQLSASDQVKIGVRRIPGIDAPFASIGASEVDTLVKAILAAAQSRQGEEEKPKKAKSKAKVTKEVA
jgi:hypothetical protein